MADSIESDGRGNQILRMSAVTTDAGDGQDFTEYTPSGSLEIIINGKVPASEFFKEKEIYYLDFSKITE